MEGPPFRSDPCSNTKEELSDCQAASREDLRGSLFILLLESQEPSVPECQRSKGMSQSWPTNLDNLMVELFDNSFL